LELESDLTKDGEAAGGQQHQQQQVQQQQSQHRPTQDQIDAQEAARKAAHEAAERAAKEAAAKEAAEKAAYEKRLAELSIDPQTKKVSTKSAEEAKAILAAEEKGIVKNARRPDLSKGEPNLDFIVDDGYADVKTPRPHPKNPLSQQAENIADKSRLCDPDVKMVVDMKKLNTAEQTQFKADLVKEGSRHEEDPLCR